MWISNSIYWFNYGVCVRVNANIQGRTEWVIKKEGRYSHTIYIFVCGVICWLGCVENWSIFNTVILKYFLGNLSKIQNLWIFGGVEEQKRHEIFQFESENPLITSFFRLVNNYSKGYFFCTFFPFIYTFRPPLFRLITVSWLLLLDSELAKKTEPNHINFLIVFSEGRSNKKYI